MLSGQVNNDKNGVQQKRDSTRKEAGNMAQLYILAYGVYFGAGVLLLLETRATFNNQEG